MMLIFVHIIQMPNLKNIEKKTELRKPGNLMIRQIKKRVAYKGQKKFYDWDKISDKICAKKKSKLYFEFAERNFLNQIKRIIKKEVSNYL